MTSEKFCLRWNDFESHISGSLKDIRDARDFFDVTLVCEEEQLQAHKVIISACSPFFRNILQRNPHQHPLVYLKVFYYERVMGFCWNENVDWNPIQNLRPGSNGDIVHQILLPLTIIDPNVGYTFHSWNAIPQYCEIFLFKY